MSFNGWKNWDTCEAWTILSNDEHCYNAIKADTTRDNIEALLLAALQVFDIEHVAFSNINWAELIEAFEQA